MSSIQQRVPGQSHSFSLQGEMRKLREELPSASARIARTLVKDGPLTMTLVVVRSGGRLHEHRAAGPVTIQVLEGKIELDVAGECCPLSAGMLLALDAGVPHAVNSARGGAFLLTVVGPQEA